RGQGDHPGTDRGRPALLSGGPRGERTRDGKESEETEGGSVRPGWFGQPGLVLQGRGQPLRGRGCGALPRRASGRAGDLAPGGGERRPDGGAAQAEYRGTSDHVAG